MLRIPHRGENYFRRLTEENVRERELLMPTADLTRPSEQELVERWRAEELERGGFSPADAVAIAARMDVDLHRAVELIKNGCSPELAKQILL